ncbi:MAG: KamA family radical SAM protein [Magnetococcales bacterium]|nr:KamA family radical SAM protein [Magnetococcales bacterium]
MSYTVAVPIVGLEQVQEMTDAEKDVFNDVTKIHAFSSNHYYLSLIDWRDPRDPIRRLVIPASQELDAWGNDDPSREASHTPIPGLQHKYGSTALLLVSNRCASICRYCFRKRIFRQHHSEMVGDFNRVLEYLRARREITNILLTGGDPLMLTTGRLDEILTRLREIEHIGIIRIGSKMPAFMPQRINDDPELLAMLRSHCQADKRIYLITHFTHPRELTRQAIASVDALLGHGMIVANQCPLIRGINDDARVLATLLRRLAWIGAPAYYLFQCRPARGNLHFTVPLEEGIMIFNEAKANCSGLAKRVRYVMSHPSGKIEMIGLTEESVIFQYWQAADRREFNRVFTAPRNPRALWLDDYPTTSPQRALRGERESKKLKKYFIGMSLVRV